MCTWSSSHVNFIKLIEIGQIIIIIIIMNGQTTGGERGPHVFVPHVGFTRHPSPGENPPAPRI